MRGRTPILRIACLLAVSTIALILFIGITGDSRRQNNAMQRARSYATELTRRLGVGKRLPLNLSPRKPSATRSGTVGMEWLSSADAYVLRTNAHAVVAAWTVPIVRAMGADGRATIFFQDGVFSVRWLTLGEFARVRSEQATTIDELRAGATERQP